MSAGTGARANGGRHASFGAFFRSGLLPALKRFERVRLFRLPFLALSLATFLFFCWLCIPLFPVLWPFLLVVGIFLTALEDTIFLRRRRHAAFSREVVAPLVNYAGGGFSSRPSFYVGPGDYLESRLFPNVYSRYEGSDFFHAARDRRLVDFSWIKVKGAGPGRRRLPPIFAGWFFVVAFRRSFRGVTIVRPDREEAAIGWLGRSLQEMTAPDGTRLVLLEDVEFEALYKVASTGQLEARHILTPQFMRLAVKTGRHVGGRLAFSFVRNCMFVAVPAKCEYFTLWPVRPFTNPAYCRQLYHAVVGVDEMADHLVRNHRVWLDSV